MSVDLVTAEQIAAENTLDPATVRAWGREGRHGFPRPYRLGRRVAWDRAEVDAWLRAQRGAA